jgi:hypothetical protein
MNKNKSKKNININIKDNLKDISLAKAMFEQKLLNSKLLSP